MSFFYCQQLCVCVCAKCTYIINIVKIIFFSARHVYDDFNAQEGAKAASSANLPACRLLAAILEAGDQSTNSTEGRQGI